MGRTTGDRGQRRRAAPGNGSRYICPAGSATLNVAVKDGILTKNPFSGEGGSKIQSKKKRILTAGEINQLVGHVENDPWWNAFVRLGALQQQAAGQFSVRPVGDADGKTHAQD